MKVKGHTPAQEAIAKVLFGIGGVPREEQWKMVSRAAWKAHELVLAERERCIKAVVDEPEPDRPTPAVATIIRAVKANILARINAQGGEVKGE